MKHSKEEIFRPVALAVSFFLLFCLLSHTSFSQPPEKPAEEAGENEVAEMKEDNITIDFKDADIRNVLRLLAEKSGINVIVGQEVEGKVTVKLVDVPWKKALDVILRSQGLVYECEDNIIRVTTVENLKKEDLVTRVFDLNYANSEKVSKAIENMVSPRGKINFDERMNLLVITDVSANLGKIGEVVERLDTRTPQVLVEARIVEVTLSKGEDLGINWSMLKGVTVGVTDVGETYKREKKSEDSSERKTSDETADKREIVDKAAATDAYTDFVLGTGGVEQIDWPAQTVASSEDTRTRTPWDKTTSLTTAATHSDISEYIQTAVLSVSDLQVVLSALKARGDFNLVSNPKVVTTDNQEAKILVGVLEPIVERFYNKETGGWEEKSNEKEEIGIKLTVTPAVNKENYITLKVQPEVSEIIGYRGQYDEWPVISTRTALTEVVIKSGDTLAIGGLISDRKREAVNKIPILGDIPFLGWLFKHRTTQTDKTDLVIFITPTILGGE